MLMFTIANREVRSYFTTTIGWLVLGFWLLIAGFFWSSMVSYYVDQSQDVVSNPYAMDQMNVIDYLLQPFFGNMCVILLMVVPAITMRSYSEEVKNKSIELLLTSPVSTFEIVMGKFLGAMGVIAVMLLGTAYVPLTLLLWWSAPDWGAVAGGYLGVLLVAGSIVALGMLASASTPNTIVAMMLTFSGALLLWLLSWGGKGEDAWQQQLSMATHITGMLRGAVKASDLTYYGAFIVFFLFATHQRVEGYRWR